MTVAVLRELLRASPFQPFELILSSGGRFLVDHPENCVPMRDRVFIAYKTSRKQNLPDASAFLSYLHIAAAEPVNRQRNRRRAS